ncbi:MAG TPA: aminotransferase class IV [Solirubrobacterales bacterium]|nr:aminotransferase class IV [Solirubrobacterales bacterium]
MSAPPHADPAWGVFETMLVLAGRAVELDAHVERLRASVAALYDSELPEGTRTLAVKRAAGIEHGKLRLTYAPPRSGAAPAAASARPELRLDAEEVEATAVFPGPERGVSLSPVTVAGGLGEHKWADRRLLERAASAAAPGELPLLLDADGSVLEASRASVFAIVGGRVVTPPTDGRILPSLARRQAIEVALEAGIEVGEGRLTLADLHRAEVFLTGSVRGVEPARAIAGAALAPVGELSARIAAGLRSRWLGPAAEPVAAAAGGRRDDPPGR